MENKINKSAKYLLIKYGRIVAGVLSIGYIIVLVYMIVNPNMELDFLYFYLAFPIVILDGFVKPDKYESELNKQFELLYKVIKKQLPSVVENQNFSYPMTKYEKKELAIRVKGSCRNYLIDRKKYYSELIINSSKEDLRLLMYSYYADKLKEDYEMYLYMMLKNLGMQ